ncbi:hypothetical protein FACS1894106_4220 [Spirochaetia bacterium]|nr:hypothetical protein FACS1894106_4220 [Spirochaetia bacterium]
MISYTIDASALAVPLLPDKQNITDYLKGLKNCSDLLDNNNIAVYLFFRDRVLLNRTEFRFDNDYQRKIMPLLRNSHFPADLYKKVWENIVDKRFEETRGERKVRCYFEDWFHINNINFHDDDIFIPNDALIHDDLIYNLKKHMIIVSLLNKYIYKSSCFHYLLTRDTQLKKVNIVAFIDEIDKERTNNAIPNDIQNPYNEEVEIADIVNLLVDNRPVYESVDDAYKKAKEEFKEYLVFGKDVEKGIKTIRESSGPPNKIFAYLQTLKEFALLKINTKNELNDDIVLLKALGCDCSDEGIEKHEDSKVKENRTWDNGSGEKKIFWKHLKPATFNRRKDTEKRTRTVRIFFDWDVEKKKVIIGWIGCHPNP